MSPYHHILVGVDLSKDTLNILNKASLLALATGAKLSVVHVLEPLTFAYGGDMPIDLSETQDQLRKRAEQELDRLIKELPHTVEQHSVVVGQAATELHNLAEHLNVDLIIIGTHGRKGFALLLGSTSNTVLQSSDCDVLAIHIHET